MTKPTFQENKPLIMVLTLQPFEKMPACHEEYLNFAYKHSWETLQSE